MQRFTELKVWQRAHGLTLAIYRLTARFPADERFGLVSQLRRAAVSIETNIAEGTKRPTPGDYARFLTMADGSATETECLLMIGRDLGCCDGKEVEAEAREIAAMLNGLRQRVLEPAQG